jgi:UDP:flavonoid glycosyltransferase YjiC (YdhE family)
MSQNRPSILLVTSNGTGMGHLTRQTAIARALGERADCVLLSLSSGIDVVEAQGIRAEYLPSYQRPWMPRQDWNAYLADRLVALATEVGADVVAFDGVAPYRGIAAARDRLPETAFVWFRRGMWRIGRNAGALRTEPFFDAIIEPGDFAQRADQGLTAARPRKVINPVSLLDVITPMGRGDAASGLGLDPARETALISLGSGALGDDAAAAAAAADILRESGWQIATTKAALATKEHGLDGVHVLRDVYPLAAYVQAFDLVISSAGYNAVHEFISAGIPTVLVPNVHTATDDQMARAKCLAEDGVAICVDPDSGTDGVRAAVERALASRTSLAAAAQERGQQQHGGAQDAATELLELAGTFTVDDPDLPRRLARSKFWLRSNTTATALKIMGPSAADALRQRRRTKLALGPVRPLEVDLVIDQGLTAAGQVNPSPEPPTHPPVRMTSRLDRGLLRGDDPFEHVLAGGSPEYVQSRLAIARRSYTIRNVHSADGALSPERD